MAWTGSTTGEFVELLLTTFNQAELDRLLNDQLNRRLSHISTGPNDIVVFKAVVDAAVRERWISDLIRAVAKARPSVHTIQAFLSFAQATLACGEPPLAARTPIVADEPTPAPAPVGDCRPPVWYARRWAWPTLAVVAIAVVVLALIRSDRLNRPRVPEKRALAAELKQTFHVPAGGVRAVDRKSVV